MFFSFLQFASSDCAEKITKYYGDIYGSTLPKGTEFVEFTPLHLRDQPQVVWNGTNLQKKGKIRMFFSYLEIFRVTQADNGYYNFRKKDNTLLSRILLIVQGDGRNCGAVRCMQAFTAVFPLGWSSSRINFFNAVSSTDNVGTCRYYSLSLIIPGALFNAGLLFPSIDKTEPNLLSLKKQIQ